MKDLGTLKLDETENTIKVYVGVSDGEMYITQKKSEAYPTDGCLTIYHDGFFPGTIEEFNRHIMVQAKEHLLSTGIIKIDGKHQDGAPWCEWNI